MNVYDFDGTIYDGDSTLDFYLFCLRKKPLLICCVLKQVWGFIGYRFGKYNKTEFKEVFFCFLDMLDNIDNYVDEFWNENECKIKSWYLNQHKKTDVIISASPEFLLGNVCKRIGIVNLIASDVDKTTGKFRQVNCKGDEKVRRFRQLFPQWVIENFYSDSLSDLPMAKLAKRAFFVQKNRMYLWKI